MTRYRGFCVCWAYKLHDDNTVRCARCPLALVLFIKPTAGRNHCGEGLSILYFLRPATSSRPRHLASLHGCSSILHIGMQLWPLYISWLVGFVLTPPMLFIKRPGAKEPKESDVGVPSTKSRVDGPYYSFLSSATNMYVTFPPLARGFLCPSISSGLHTVPVFSQSLYDTSEFQSYFDLFSSPFCLLLPAFLASHVQWSTSPTPVPPLCFLFSPCDPSTLFSQRFCTRDEIKNSFL